MTNEEYAAKLKELGLPGPAPVIDGRVDPEAYEDGYQFGLTGIPSSRKFHAEICGEDEVTLQSISYGAFYEGVCAGERRRWIEERREGEGMLEWHRRTRKDSK